jgi:hypothetical protein
MLETALALRSLVQCIDAVDEAPGHSAAVDYYYVLNTLVSMGLQVVVASRPAGVRLSSSCPEYDAYLWVVLDLAPLTTCSSARRSS